MITTHQQQINILYIDDEAGARAVLGRAIAGAVEGRMDAVLHEFEDEADAINFASANSIDIAFLDINLRNMSGVELAREIKKTNPKVNIIFVTGYSEYIQDALNIHASGYIRKPVRKENIVKELDNLLFPVGTGISDNSTYSQEKNIDHTVNGVYAKTFGNFDLMVDGRIVEFSLSKAKELLAYLIDRRGSSVSRKEIAAKILENKDYNLSTQSYLSKIYAALVVSLKEHGCEGIIVKGRNAYAVDMTKIHSDLQEYLEGDPQAISAYRGEYMAQYSWAEDTAGTLL